MKSWVLLLSLGLWTAPLMARDNVMLVLDASGSMWGQIDGRSKVEIARSAVSDLLDGWNPEHHLGLIAYGHNRRGDCADIELLIPPSPLDTEAFRRIVYSLNARGMTPLSAAVREAATVLRSSEQKATVILVSDGEENCGLDPCLIGTELAAEGIDFTAHVIGFDLGDTQREAGLRCLAENTGGVFLSASNAADLSASLGAIAALTTETQQLGGTALLDAPDTAVEADRLTVGYSGPAERGDYIAVVDNAEQVRAYTWIEVGVEQGEVRIDLPAGAGDYWLRYIGVLREPPVLAERALQLTPAEAVIQAPDSVPQGSLVSVHLRGPHEGGLNWVAIAPVGAPVGEHLGWDMLTEPEQSFSLLAPSQPGEYEIRFVLDGGVEPLVSRPLRVSPAEIMIAGPAEVRVGERFNVRAIGPKHSDFWITIVEAEAGEGEYRSWAHLEQGRDDYELIAPGMAGAYELRYVLVNPQTVMARQTIAVVAANVTWAVPTAVRVGESFVFTVTGPLGEGHYVTLVPSGSPTGHYEAWQWISESGEYDWVAPEQSGSWELRYMLGDGSVVGHWPLHIEP